MAYKEKWALAINNDNIALVMMATVDVALSLLGDPETNAAVAAYATSCLNNPWQSAQKMTLGVVFVATSTSDIAIREAVELVFSAYAGVQAVA